MLISAFSLIPGLGEIVGYIYPNEFELHWGLLIVLYPYLTGLVAGAFILASLERVFNVKVLKPVYRLSLLSALAFLFVAPMPLLAHLGHPERAFEMFLTPHTQSAMAMFGFVYAWYLMVVLLLEIWLDYRKDIVIWSQTRKGISRIIYKILSLGTTDISEAALKLDDKIGRTLTIIESLPKIADYLDRMEVDIQGMRALAYTAAQAVELQNRLELKLKLAPPLDEDERKAMERRVRYLRNELVTIADGFHLAGVDDHSADAYPGHGEDLPRATALRDPGKPLVLMAHQPRQVRRAAKHGVDLQLSGHTHGGQIWPWHYIVRVQQGGLLAGRYEHRGTQLYVTRGCGYWGPPVRLLAPLEITRIILRAA